MGHSANRTLTSRDFDQAPARIDVLLPKVTFEVENDGKIAKRDALDDDDEDTTINRANRALTSREMQSVLTQLLILSKSHRK